jgi:hypothetical protein
MKKTYFALITFSFAFAAQAVTIEIPEQFVGSYVAKGEKCDRAADGKFKTGLWLIVSKQKTEKHYFDEHDDEFYSSVCRPIKPVKVKGDSVTFEARCEVDDVIQTYRLTKTQNGIGLTGLNVYGSRYSMESHTACPAK